MLPLLSWQTLSIENTFYFVLTRSRAVVERLIPPSQKKKTPCSVSPGETNNAMLDTQGTVSKGFVSFGLSQYTQWARVFVLVLRRHWARGCQREGTVETSGVIIPSLSSPDKEIASRYKTWKWSSSTRPRTSWPSPPPHNVAPFMMARHTFSKSTL